MAGKSRLHGGVTLGMTLLLLLLMGGLLAYSAQQQVNELRLQASEFRQREAFSQAEANLAQAIALLTRYHERAPAQALWPTPVRVQSQALQTYGSQGWLWQLSSPIQVAESRVLVQRQVLATPLLVRRPPRALLLAGVDPGGERSELLDYLFAMPRVSQALGELRRLAVQAAGDCQTLNSQTSGLILVHGACVLRGQIGTQAEPALLVLTSGELQLTSDTSFHGLLLLLGDDGSSSVQWSPGARLYGAVASHTPLPPLAPGAIEYRADIVVRLQASPALWRYEPVAGSWRDW
ncbi:MAG: hypothetical protein ACRCRW_10465 [Aeromonadaceae bacterium]